MNKSLNRVVIAFCVVALLTAVSAYGQVLKANVPFPYRVGEKTVAAGECTISIDTAARRMVLQPAVGDAFIVGPHTASSVVPRAKSVLVFVRYGETYFLRQVWTAGMNIGQELPSTKPEREYARLGAPYEVALVNLE